MRPDRKECEKSIDHEAKDIELARHGCTMMMANPQLDRGKLCYRGQEIPVSVDLSVFQRRNSLTRQQTLRNCAITAVMNIMLASGGSLPFPELKIQMRHYTDWSDRQIELNLSDLVSRGILTKIKPAENHLPGHVGLMKLETVPMLVSLYYQTQQEQLDMESDATGRFLISGKSLPGIEDQDHLEAQQWAIGFWATFKDEIRGPIDPFLVAKFRHQLRAAARDEVERQIKARYSELNRGKSLPNRPFGKMFPDVFWGGHYMLHMGPRQRSDLERAVSYRYYSAEDGFKKLIDRGLDFGLFEEVTKSLGDSTFSGHKLKFNPIDLSDNYRWIFSRYSLNFEYALELSWNEGLQFERFLNFEGLGRIIRQARDDYWRYMRPPVTIA